jgi:hypothetical protein
VPKANIDEPAKVNVTSVLWYGSQGKDTSEKGLVLKCVQWTLRVAFTQKAMNEYIKTHFIAMLVISPIITPQEYD